MSLICVQNNKNYQTWIDANDVKCIEFNLIIDKAGVITIQLSNKVIILRGVDYETIIAQINNARTKNNNI